LEEDEENALETYQQGLEKLEESLAINPSCF